jgi:hypothetical protein
MMPIMGMKLYTELASWWPLVSPPSHYVEEAADLLPMLMQAADARPRTLLELGSGGGSLAFHLKAHVRMTLSDVSPAMLHQSRQVNPKCEHVVVDMRTLDLGRTFDLTWCSFTTRSCTRSTNHRCVPRSRLRSGTAVPAVES